MVEQEIVTFLEMTSPDQLRPPRPPPLSLEMERLDRGSVGLVRTTYERIGAPYNWSGRSAWSDETWEELLSRPGVESWLARVDDDVAGMVELDAQPDGAVEIVVFGLVPQFVGKGLGAHFLLMGTRLAWEAKAPGGGPARRVWLHTSSRDHPHARSNYEGRGFRTFRTEQGAALRLVRTKRR